MWVDEKKYRETLDFDLFLSQMKQFQPSEGEILHDIQKIGTDTYQFFKDLLAAENTDDLKNYSMDTILENSRKLSECRQVLEEVSIMIQDETLLGDPQQLYTAMNIRGLSALRRVL